MELFQGKVLLLKDGTTISADAALRNKRIVCLYFSAQWCPPCVTFTPVLAEAYREAKQLALPIEENQSPWLFFCDRGHPVRALHLIPDGQIDKAWKQRALNMGYRGYGATAPNHRYVSIQQDLQHVTEIIAEAKETNICVVFVSANRSLEEMQEDLRNHHADWVSLPFGDNLQASLKARFKVAGIPTLVILKADGSLICANGRPDVQTKGSQAFKDWLASI